VTAGEFFEAVRRMPFVPWQQVTRGAPFVVFMAHPDHESLGMGGLIALATKARQAVTMVLLTDGAGSPRRSRSHPHERLIAVRGSCPARSLALPSTCAWIDKPLGLLIDLAQTDDSLTKLAAQYGLKELEPIGPSPETQSFGSF